MENEASRSDCSPVAVYYQDVRECSEQEFAAKHPHPFLVLDNLMFGKSRWFGGKEPGPDALMVTQQKRAGKAGHQRWVLPVRRSSQKSEPAPIMLGRGKSNDLVLDDVTISRQHASFEWRDGTWWVMDLGSANRTRIDDHPIAPHAVTRIEEGATLHLGEVIGFFCGPAKFHRYVSELMHDVPKPSQVYRSS